MTGGWCQRLRTVARVYWVLVSASLRGQMQYRLDFIGNTLIQAIMGADSLILIVAVLARFGPIMGWTTMDIAMLFAVTRVGNGVYMLICNELDRFEAYMVTGDFDSLLIRPWPPLFTLLAQGTGVRRLSFLAQGIAAFAVAAPRLAAVGAVAGCDWAWLALAMAWTSLLYFAVGLATAAAGFWLTRIDELQVFTMIAPTTATTYPLDVYPSWMRKLLLSVLPIGLGNYLPLRFILGKGGSQADLLWPAIGCPLAVAAALWLWNRGVSRYSSTGT
jgi:ABC-2 type transport system permease protein